MMDIHDVSRHPAQAGEGVVMVVTMMTTMMATIGVMVIVMAMMAMLMMMVMAIRTLFLVLSILRRLPMNKDRGKTWTKKRTMKKGRVERMHRLAYRAARLSW